MSPQPVAVKGWNTYHVFFSDGGGAALGTFRQGSGKDWVETDTQGNVRFNFVEVGRDEWPVYLQDPSRGVGIQLDLWTRLVMYSDANTGATPLYNISEAH